jgi:hypothetical protein
MRSHTFPRPAFRDPEHVLSTVEGTKAIRLQRQWGPPRPENRSRCTRSSDCRGRHSAPPSECCRTRRHATRGGHLLPSSPGRRQPGRDTVCTGSGTTPRRCRHFGNNSFASGQLPQAKSRPRTRCQGLTRTAQMWYPMVAGLFASARPLPWMLHHRRASSLPIVIQLAQKDKSGFLRMAAISPGTKTP